MKGLRILAAAVALGVIALFGIAFFLLITTLAAVLIGKSAPVDLWLPYAGIAWLVAMVIVLYIVVGVIVKGRRSSCSRCGNHLSIWQRDFAGCPRCRAAEPRSARLQEPVIETVARIFGILLAGGLIRAGVKLMLPEPWPDYVAGFAQLALLFALGGEARCPRCGVRLSLFQREFSGCPQCLTTQSPASFAWGRFATLAAEALFVAGLIILAVLALPQSWPGTVNFFVLYALLVALARKSRCRQCGRELPMFRLAFSGCPGCRAMQSRPPSFFRGILLLIWILIGLTYDARLSVDQLNKAAEARAKEIRELRDHVAELGKGGLPQDR